MTAALDKDSYEVKKMLDELSVELMRVGSERDAFYATRALGHIVARLDRIDSDIAVLQASLDNLTRKLGG
jgi:prefoldin subunit 5